MRTVDEGQRYRLDFHARLIAAGREPQDLKILPGIDPIVGTSRDEAKEKEDFLETLVPERIGVDLVSSWSGVDVSGHPIDGPLPPLPDIDTYDGQRSNLERIKAFADQGLSIRKIAHRLINAGAVPSIIGTPVDIADQLEAWFKGGAADGFNLMFPLLPEDWLQFTTLVVPELQRRGLAQTDVPWRHPARSLELEETKQSLPSKLTISAGKGSVRKGRVVSRLVHDVYQSTNRADRAGA